MTTLIGKNAPNFTTIAILPDSNVQGDYDFWAHAGVHDGMSILVFFSMAFSYVCPTELLALAAQYEEFKNRNVQVFAISCDQHVALQRWLQLPVESGGLGSLPFTLLSDPSGRIAETYDVLVNQSVSLRATFLIDKLGVVRAQLMQDFHLGRNTDEILRLIDAHQHHEKTGEMTPANWQSYQPALTADPAALAQYLRRMRDAA